MTKYRTFARVKQDATGEWVATLESSDVIPEDECIKQYSILPQERWDNYSKRIEEDGRGWIAVEVEYED